MRNFMMALGAFSLVVPVTVSFTPTKAEAQNSRKYRGYNRRQVDKRCRKSSGTTGLVAGGVGGALVGNAVGGGLLGTVAGGAAGALGGRAIDRSITAKKRCRYYR